MRLISRVILGLTLLTSCAQDPGNPVQPVALVAQARPSPGSPGVGTTRLGENPRLAQGQELYTKYCALCHGATGEGYAADNAPSLVNSTFLESASPTFLREAIAKGRPGTAMAGYNKDVGGPLTRLEINTLVTWLRRDAPPLLPLPSHPVGGNLSNGQRVYDKNCQSCHGTPDQRKDAVHLFNEQLLATASPSYLKHAIEKGRPGTPMEAWEGKITPAEIVDVVTFITSFAPAQVTPPAPKFPEVPEWGPIVINPQGKQASFTLRDGRFASIKDVNDALEKKQRIIILDARAPSDWLRLHITGSLPLPYYDLTPIEKLPNDGTWIIAYCGCPHHASGVVVDGLRERGYSHSAVLDEGVFAWQQAGYPVVKSETTGDIPAPPSLVLPTNPTSPGDRTVHHDHAGHNHP